MLSRIKITDNEMRYMALFENMTGATILDCVVDEGEGLIIFAVKRGEIGLAIGRKGEKIKRFKKLTNKQIEVFEYYNSPIKFIRKALRPARIREIKLVDRVDGGRAAIVSVEPKDKGIAIGKNGRNIKMIRFLAKRYFNLENVVIT
ncbi:NusA-like transcription termination signal-binding factor [Candidatus Bathyarchaeota archaeon]|nr:MAG: NusA-like transcription termination signal-binding factor [Candidatus Bathyarchaeota archaeon]RLI31902.1 MAG: NusA-like transcription termination signal-binding factor [Candidatus Bathyarchaeota archaeon]